MITIIFCAFFEDIIQIRTYIFLTHLIEFTYKIITHKVFLS